MAVVQRFHISGLRELEQALRLLPRATGKNVLKRTLMKAALPVEQAAATKAIRRTGQLKRSVKISTKLSTRQRSLNPKRSPVEVYVGAGPLPHAHMVEFGSAHNKPEPFMTPAWDGNRMRVLSVIKRTLADEILKAAARRARRLAKGTASSAV